MLFKRDIDNFSAKEFVSFIIIFFISFIFSYKYCLKFSENLGLIPYLHISLQILIVISIYKINSLNRLLHKNFSLIIIFSAIIIIIFTIAVHFFIDVNSLNVDRWSIISKFWEAVFASEYPYFAQSNMGNYPGPMPVYFIIALPFYLLGELSLLSVLAYIFVVLMVYKRKKINSNAISLLFLIMSSAFMYWEISVRSNIFTYSFLILLALYYFESIDKNRYDKHFFISGIATGLVLSTRSVFFLVYVLYFISLTIKKEISIKSIILYLIISMTAFFSTLLPFLFFYEASFWQLNPFIIQSTLLPSGNYLYIFVLLSIILSLFAKNTADRTFYSGLLLFVISSIYFVYHIVTDGFYSLIHSSAIDISYFLFCLPFIVYYIVENDSKYLNCVDNKQFFKDVPV